MKQAKPPGRQPAAAASHDSAAAVGLGILEAEVPLVAAALARRPGQARAWRRRHDLDFGHETAGLAPELAAELDGVEGPGDDHLLFLVHHLLEDESATLCVQA